MAPAVDAGIVIISLRDLKRLNNGHTKLLTILNRTRV